jgi:hypothetical protein
MRKEYDTLSIELSARLENIYRLLRSSTFQERWMGKTFPGSIQKKNGPPFMMTPEKLLNETRKGKVISFVPERKHSFGGYNVNTKKIK